MSFKVVVEDTKVEQKLFIFRFGKKILAQKKKKEKLLANNCINYFSQRIYCTTLKKIFSYLHNLFLLFFFLSHR